MSTGIISLHSHSGLERFLRLPKHVVVIDSQFAHLFDGGALQPLRYGGRDYFKVSTLAFIKAGGTFRNLNL